MVLIGRVRRRTGARVHGPFAVSPHPRRHRPVSLPTAFRAAVNRILSRPRCMVIRRTASFAVKWLAAKLTQTYERDLKDRAYELAIGHQSPSTPFGRGHFQSRLWQRLATAGRVIGRIIQFFQQAILCLVYIGSHSLSLRCWQSVQLSLSAVSRRSSIRHRARVRRWRPCSDGIRTATGDNTGGDARYP